MLVEVAIIHMAKVCSTLLLHIIPLIYLYIQADIKQLPAMDIEKSYYLCLYFIILTFY